MILLDAQYIVCLKEVGLFFILWNNMSSSENNLENALIAKLEELKYKRNEIHDLDSLNANFRNNS